MLTSILALASVLAWSQSPAVDSTDLIISSGNVRLAATLSIPKATGKVPAALLLAGSGPATRRELRRFADHLNTLGFATLVYDKRGAGQSTGDWTSASMEDMVADAAAAIATLAAHDRIDAGKIGVWGVSQAGWFIPVLAARSQALAFAVVLTGGGATPREVEMFMHGQALARNGASPEDMKGAERLLAAYFDWLGTGEGRDRVAAMISEARTKPWYAAVSLDRVMPSEANRPNWEWVATFDPAPWIAKMTVPALVLLGADDRMGSPTDAAERWRAGFAAAGNRRATVEVVPGMGHAGTIGPDHQHGSATLAAYFTAVEKFLATLSLTGR